ncbi:NAD(P)/FAD-dependent oxidoreductase [Melioribacter sp. Ez-97]|uniref:NAD(P)/FAD-dependent oxidoreductase n=1 Tax=Melioribacter sp. Ez-97 TaxID=3423434 RepID=UPI003ED9315F
MRDNNTITIVGAGPGGLTAAIALKKAGYNVDVYEQNSDVGLRFNGDYQGLENWSDEQDTLEILKNIGIEINFLCRPYSGNDGCFVGPKRERIQVKTSRPLFYLIERGSGKNSLDQGLKHQALEAGVNIVWNKKIESAADNITIAGTGPKAADAIAKGIVFNTSVKDQFIGFVDNRIAPKAYAYLLVNNGRATFATCMFEDFKNERRYFERALNVLKSHIDIDINSPKEFGGFVNYFTPVTKKNKILYVGENAGFQDGLWGFGIKYAMLSGYYAAQSIIKNEDYAELCKNYLFPKLRTSLANRWLFAHLTNSGYSYILKKLQNLDDVIPPLRKHYNPSFSKKIFYHIAKMWYKSRLIDKQCMHVNCNCVWCRHACVPKQNDDRISARPS